MAYGPGGVCGAWAPLPESLALIASVDTVILGDVCYYRIILTVDSDGSSETFLVEKSVGFLNSVESTLADDFDPTTATTVFTVEDQEGGTWTASFSGVAGVANPWVGRECGQPCKCSHCWPMLKYDMEIITNGFCANRLCGQLGWDSDLGKYDSGNIDLDSYGVIKVIGEPFPLEQNICGIQLRVEKVSGGSNLSFGTSELFFDDGPNNLCADGSLPMQHFICQEKPQPVTNPTRVFENSYGTRGNGCPGQVRTYRHLLSTTISVVLVSTGQTISMINIGLGDCSMCPSSDEICPGGCKGLKIEDVPCGAKVLTGEIIAPDCSFHQFSFPIYSQLRPERDSTLDSYASRGCQVHATKAGGEIIGSGVTQLFMYGILYYALRTSCPGDTTPEDPYGYTMYLRLNGSCLIAPLEVYITFDIASCEPVILEGDFPVVGVSDNPSDLCRICSSYSTARLRITE
jgi:hypothetical protein